MSADLIARLIEAGTPPALVAEVAMALGRAAGDQEALAHRRATEAANTARYRARGGDQVPGWMRRQVFERDDYRCVDCGSEERLECDHVLPLMKGGETNVENLQCLCKPCNARKRDRVRKAEERGQTRTNSDVAGPARDTADAAPTPAPSFPPNPPITPTHTPGITPRARKAETCWPVPDGVDPDHWRDLLTNRRSKRLPNTPTAHKRLLSDLAKFADDDWPPGRLVEFAAERGWGAIFDPRGRDGTRHRQNGTGQFGRGAHHPGGRECAAADLVFPVGQS